MSLSNETSTTTPVGMTDPEESWTAEEYIFLDRFCECLSGEPSLEGQFKAALAILMEYLSFTHVAILYQPENEAGKPIFIQHGSEGGSIDLHARAERYLAGRTRTGGLSVSCFPFEQSEQGSGVLLFEPPLSSEEDKLARMALRPLSRAVRSNTLMHAAWHRGKEMAALNKITAILASTLQFDDILPFILDGIQQMVGAEAATFNILDSEPSGLVFRHSTEGNVQAIKLHQAPGYVARCLEERTPILVNQVSQTRGSKRIETNQGFDIQSLLCVPLIARGSLLGMIEVANKLSGPFNLQDRDLLMSLAASAANAIYNARLFQQLKVVNADLEAGHWEVLQSRSVLQTLFDAITAEICIIDDQHLIVTTNAACAKAAGKHAEDILGKPCYVELAGLDQPCAGCRAVEAAYSSKRKEWQRRRWSKAGEPNNFEMTAYPLREAGSGTLQAIVFAKDVSEKNRMEAVLAQSEKMAAVGRLATGVAHEISNPLTAMIGNAQLLRRSVLEEEQIEALDMMIEAGERARQVIQNLLDLAGDDHCERTPQDVNASIRAAVMRFQGDCSFELVMDLDRELPLIAGNRDQLESLWRHLIVNAGDAFGDERGVILIKSKLSDAVVRVMISEYGREIPSGDLASLFDPYASISSTTSGQGVGLTICRRIAKLHGGAIHVSSLSGEATTFTVELPILLQHDV